MFTTDPIYKKPLVPRITVLTLDKVSTLYTFDPWTDVGTSGKLIQCNVQLSQNHQGIFTFQIEGDAYSPPFSNGDRVVIECGKQSTQMTRLISGVIRQRGATRGADQKKLLTFTGSSTAIRLNERVTYFIREAAKLAQDGITIDVTDANMKADLLLQTGLSLGTYPTTEVIDTSNITTRSDVENFIPSIAVEYGESQDVVNAIEEASNGEVFVDANDLVQFRHQLQPPVSGKGFTIKNKNATNDNADDTMYLRGNNWDYTESISKTDNYSNHLYGILQADPDPNVSTPPNVGGLQTNTNEIAQRFRPTHSHWLPGDIFLFGFLHRTSTTVPANLNVMARICRDNAGVPQNVGGIIASMFNRVNVQENTSTDDTIQQLNLLSNTSGAALGSFDLDVTKNYWLIVTHTGGATNDYFRWDYRTVGGGSGLLVAPYGTSTFANGGSGWVTSLSPGLMWFSLPRRRSQAFQTWDTKAINAIDGGTTRGGLFDTTLSSLPSYVKTKESIYRYMTGQLYYSSRPRINYNFPAVTAPNVPVLPGDPILIQDSVLGFSAAGSQAVMATCGDMNYSWSSLGGQGQTYQAPTILSINAVSNPTRYR